MSTCESSRRAVRADTSGRWSIALAVGLLALSACSSGSGTTTFVPEGANAGGRGLGLGASPAPFPTAFDPALLAPMNALPVCGEPPVALPEAQEATAGLGLPAGSVATSIDVAGAIVQVQGYVPLTPVQILDVGVHAPDLTVLAAEHEEFESELLYEVDTSDGRHRVYLKSQVSCATGSLFVAVLTPAEPAP